MKTPYLQTFWRRKRNNIQHLPLRHKDNIKEKSLALPHHHEVPYHHFQVTTCTNVITMSYVSMCLSTSHVKCNYCICYILSFRGCHLEIWYWFREMYLSWVRDWLHMVICWFYVACLHPCMLGYILENFGLMYQFVGWLQELITYVQLHVSMHMCG